MKPEIISGKRKNDIGDISSSKKLKEYRQFVCLVGTRSNGKRLIFDRHTKGALLTYKQIFTTSKMPQLGLAAEAP